MPEREDHGQPAPGDAVAHEPGVDLAGQRDGAAPALEQRPGDGDTPPGRAGRFGRHLRNVGATVMVLDVVGLVLVLSGHVPDYPYLPIAIGSYVAYVIGRALMVRDRLARGGA